MRARLCHCLKKLYRRKQNSFRLLLLHLIFGYLRKNIIIMVIRSLPTLENCPIGENKRRNKIYGSQGTYCEEICSIIIYNNRKVPNVKQYFKYAHKSGQWILIYKFGYSNFFSKYSSKSKVQRNKLIQLVNYRLTISFSESNIMKISLNGRRALTFIRTDILIH